jgi:hypothetical protein
MEIRIAEISALGRRYFVMYPLPSPARGPVLMILDAEGAPLSVAGAGASRRPRIMAAAFAAVESGAGEPLKERLDIPSFSALDQADRLGWLILPPGGEAPILPAGGDISPPRVDVPAAGRIIPVSELNAV